MIDYEELAEAMGDLDEDTVKELLPYHYRLLFPDPSGLLPVPPPSSWGLCLPCR